jgi:type I restriction enzyme S subunit
MSRLEELIADYCPEGVEYKPLWAVTIWDKKFNAVDRKKQPHITNYNYLLAADLFALQQDGGNVFLLSTGEQTGWTTEELAGENMKEGEVVTIPWGKSRAVIDCIKYYKGKFVTADNRIMTSNDIN